MRRFADFFDSMQALDDFSWGDSLSHRCCIPSVSLCQHYWSRKHTVSQALPTLTRHSPDIPPTTYFTYVLIHFNRPDNSPDIPYVYLFDDLPTSYRHFPDIETYINSWSWLHFLVWWSHVLNSTEQCNATFYRNHLNQKSSKMQRDWNVKKTASH